MNKYYLHIIIIHALLLIGYSYHHLKKANFFAPKKCQEKSSYINQINQLLNHEQDMSTLTKNLTLLANSNCSFIISKIQITPNTNKEKVTIQWQT